MVERTLTVTVADCHGGRRRWPLKFTKLKGDTNGWCWSPGSRSKKILIDNTPRPRRNVVEDIVHELLHAADWSKDESWVTAVAEDIARTLDRLEKLGIIGELSDG